MSGRPRRLFHTAVRLLLSANVLTLVIQSALAQDLTLDSVSDRTIDLIFPETKDWVKVHNLSFINADVVSIAPMLVQASISRNGRESLFLTLPNLKDIFQGGDYLGHFHSFRDMAESTNILYDGPIPDQEGNVFLWWRQNSSSLSLIAEANETLVRIDAASARLGVSIISNAGEPKRAQLVRFISGQSFPYGDETAIIGSVKDGSQVVPSSDRFRVTGAQICLQTTPAEIVSCPDGHVFHISSHPPEGQTLGVLNVQAGAQWSLVRIETQELTTVTGSALSSDEHLVHHCPTKTIAPLSNCDVGQLGSLEMRHYAAVGWVRTPQQTTSPVKP